MRSGKDSSRRSLQDLAPKTPEKEPEQKSKVRFNVEMSIRNSMAGDLLFNGMRRDDIWQPSMVQKYDEYQEIKPALNLYQKVCKPRIIENSSDDSEEVDEELFS